MSSARSRQTITIDDVLRTLPDAPVATTRGRGWGGLTLDLHGYRPGYSLRTPARDHHLICYCPTGSARLVQGRSGVVHESIISAGMSLIMPAGYDSIWEGDAVASARLRMPLDLVAAATEQLGARSAVPFEMRNVFETRDIFIERIAMTLSAEIDRTPHPTQTLIVDTLSCALAAHLLRAYNAFELHQRRQTPLLSPSELASLTDYIEANIDCPIGLAELAAIVNVSRFHFARLFKRSTGTTAIHFVEQCRIRRAQALIVETGIPLAEIALAAGFSDQSHFTRRFHRHVGCTPATFARQQGRRRSGRRGS